ncbi:MAG: hypothetical protein KDC65_11845 [Saprospiraceae bacterium]|nr:hypothetical protein [Saprospiraceae bacterium]
MAQHYMHLNARLVALFVWYVLSLASTLQAQHLQFAFHHLSRNQGLSQGTCPYVSRDSRGFVWVATTDGLNRFDGRHVRVYRPDPGSRHSLVGNIITSACYEDSITGDLWFTTYNAIHRYVREYDHFDTFRLKTRAGEVLVGDYYAFHLDKQDRLWLRAGSGNQGELHWFNIRTGRDSVLCPLAGNRSVVIPDRSGAIRQVLCSVLDSPGLEIVEMSPGFPRRRYFQENNTNTNVREVCVESDTLAWLGLRNGIAAFNPQTGTSQQYSTFGEQIAGSVWSVCPYGKRLLFVATRQKGLWVFDRLSRKFVQQFVHEADNPYSLLDNEVMNLHIDRQENLWVAHWKYGLSYVNLRKNKFYIPPATRGNSFWQFLEGPDGNIWCCEPDKGIFVYTADGQPVDTLDSYFPEIQERLGFTDPLYFPEGKRFGFYRDNLLEWDGAKRALKWVKKLPLTIAGLCTTPAGRILVAGKKGIFALHHSPAGDYSFGSLVLNSPVQPKSILAIHSDRRGNIYVSDNLERLLIYTETSQGGLVLKKAIEGTGDCSVFFERPDGQELWVAGSGGLLNIDRDLNARILNESADSLPNATYYSVIPDRHGRLWLSSNQGLLCYDTVRHNAIRYLPVDGLFGYEFNTGAFYLARNGKIWAGGLGGMVIFHPDSIRNVPFEPQVQFTQIFANDAPLETARQVEVLESLDIPYDQNTLSFEFVALEFSDPEANTFRYRMLGYDNNWVESGARGFARYANLPPGNYIFEVLAANSDGVWSTAPKQLNIHIRTPFYMTWWFYLLCTIATAGLVYAWFRYRLEQALKIERMRVQISSDLHDDVGTLLSGLAMQSEVLEITAPEKDKGKLRRLSEISRDAMARMRDTVWAIDARKDKLENLLDRMREHAEETLGPRGIRFSIEATGLNPKHNLPTDIRQNLYLIYKEAVTNAARHSNGDFVSVLLQKTASGFEMHIVDNGRVVEKTWKTTGSGTSNMLMRAEKIGAALEISREDGFCVILRMKTLG